MPPTDHAMTRTNTRFGLIGTGRITRRLVADLQSTDGCEVTAIASRSLDRATWCGGQYGVATAVAGYADLLKRDDVDAVYISLPPSLHAEWAIAAADAGKQVLCEKPLAMNADEAVRIREACRSAGVRWLCATAWLHHARTAAFRQVLSERRLGDVRHVSASVSFFEPFQTGEHRLQAPLGGGCVLDLAWYAAGLVRFALGATCESVYATSVDRDGVPIRCTAVMRFAGNQSATVSCGYDTATRKWFEIAGTDASLICDDFTRPWADKPARFWIHDASGKVDQSDFDDQQERRMIETLIGDEDLTEYHRQAIDTHRMIDAITASLESGQPEPTFGEGVQACI